MGGAGCCPWLCCCRSDPADAAPVAKDAPPASATELRQLASPTAAGDVGSRDGTLTKQADTTLNRRVASNGVLSRTLREPGVVSERLLGAATPSPTPSHTLRSTAAAVEPAPTDLEVPVPEVDPIIRRRLDQLQDQDPLEAADGDSEPPAGGDQRGGTLLRFTHGFYRGDAQWLSEALHMVERAVAVDVLLPVDPAVRYSSSVVDLADIVAQVRSLPLENYSNKKDIEKLLNDICRCCSYYAEEILKRTAYENDSLEMKQVQHLCVSVSDVEQARSFLVQQLSGLPLDEMATLSATRSSSDPVVLQEALADAIQDTANTLARLLRSRIDFIASKVVCGLRRAILDPQQLGGESEAWLRHMDDMLAVLYACLRPNYLQRLLDTCWESFRPAVKKAIDDHPYESVSWFRRLEEECHQLVSFVARADDRSEAEGCPAEAVRAAVASLLQPYAQDAPQLLHTARVRRSLELAACAASDVGDGLLGNLGVRAHREQQGGHCVLSVQIMHASQLHPSLSKKLYVKMKFSPKEQFKGVDKFKTKPCKKAIPLFDSLFTVRLPTVPPDALLVFVVKKVSSSVAKKTRALAVAYLPFADVPTSEGALEHRLITYLPLGEPGKSDPEIFRILEHRKQDKKTKKILKKDIKIV